jgi:GR25 family glycosyltransferase involved in LPS biosynthesis
MEKEKDYLDGIDVIYWINLDRAKDRHKHMTDLFKDDIFKNKKVIRKKAVDYTEKNLATMIDAESMRHTEQQYACLLSHLETIRLFSETNYKTALILEDDISLDFKPYWVKTIQEVIDGAPKDWDIIKLYIAPTCINKYKKLYTLWDAKNKVLYIGKKFENTVPKPKFDIDWGSVAYLINNKAAKKFIKNIYHNKKYVLNSCLEYHVSDYFIYKLLKTYVYKYPYFTFRKNNTSYIQIKNAKYDNKIREQSEQFIKILKDYKNKQTKKHTKTNRKNKTAKHNKNIKTRKNTN